MVGFVIWVLVVLAGVFGIGYLTGKAQATQAGPRKSELKRAKRALAQLDELLAQSSLELGMLGSNVAEKGSEILRNYWRGDTK